MKARDLMTQNPLSVTPADTARHAAEAMRRIDVGSMPVVAGADTPLLVGIITDRDLVVRCMAAGHDGSCSVQSHMTTAPLQTVEPGDDETVVVEKMERAQVRRIPVVNADRELVGIIAQADIATKLGPSEPEVVDEVLERISASASVE
jgi:CBS domain-containing protein